MTFTAQIYAFCFDFIILFIINRLTAAPVIIEGSETSTTNTSVIKGKCTTSSMEVLECLLEKNPNTDQKIVEYVEVGILVQVN